MDYEIEFDEAMNRYNVATDSEFSVIADWVGECLQEKEEIQKVLQKIHLLAAETNTLVEYDTYQLQLSKEGVAVSYKVDLSNAKEDIELAFDNQSDFYQLAEEGVKSECGLEDLATLLENWYKVLY